MANFMFFNKNFFRLSLDFKTDTQKIFPLN